MHPKNLSISDFDYPLTEEKIAVYPLKKRDESKLLVYKNEIISEDIYRNIANHLPENSLLIFNDTKVIKARILFKKITGAIIEIFCLEPHEKINDYTVVLAKKNSVKWKCMIGGAGKWKEKFPGFHDNSTTYASVNFSTKAAFKMTVSLLIVISFCRNHRTCR